MPFSFLEIDGFHNLMRELEPRYNIPVITTFSCSVIPDMYSRVRGNLEKEIRCAKLISFTNDVWTSMNNLNSYLSLSAHLIDDEWNRKFAILQMRQMEGCHTSELIAEEIKSILEEWNTIDTQRGVLLRDNGSSMVKAGSFASFDDLGCYIHTMQLVINCGLKAQTALSLTLLQQHEHWLDTSVTQPKRQKL